MSPCLRQVSHTESFNLSSKVLISPCLLDNRFRLGVYTPRQAQRRVPPYQTHAAVWVQPGIKTDLFIYLFIYLFLSGFVLL